MPAALQAAITRHVQDDADLAASRDRRGDQGGALAADVLAETARHVAIERDTRVMAGVVVRGL